MRRAAAMLLLLEGVALAQPQPPPETPATPADAPADESPTPPGDDGPSLGDLLMGDGGSIEDIGIGFFLGVAACRSGSYGDTDPEIRGYTVTGKLLEKEEVVRALVDAARTRAVSCGD